MRIGVNTLHEQHYCDELVDKVVFEQADNQFVVTSATSPSSANKPCSKPSRP
jgi:hypothetical protein